MREPVSLGAALTAVLSTGIALLGYYLHMTPEAMALWVGFGTAAIALIVGYVVRANVTPTSAPVLPSGTAVTTPEGSPAKVVRLYAEARTVPKQG